MPRLATTARAIAAALTVSAVTPAIASADLLKEPQTGLTVQAPKGWKLSYTRGTYRLTGGGGYALIQLGRSPLPLKETAKQIVKASKGKVGKIEKNTAAEYRALLKVSGRDVRVRLRKAGEALEVTVVGRGPVVRARRLAGSTASVSNALPLPLLAAFDRILRTRRGGAVVPLEVAVPMQRFVTLDNGARADVPVLPGWSADGGGGFLAVFSQTQGYGWFGTKIGVTNPGCSFGRIFHPISNNPVDALVNVLPVYTQQLTGANMRFLSATALQGTEGALGPTYASAFIAARVLINGKPYQGIFLWGNGGVGDPCIWIVYTSFIVVAEDAPGGIATALLRTWNSYSGDVGFRRSLSQMLDLLGSLERKEAFDPGRFDRETQTWQAVVNGSL